MLRRDEALVIIQIDLERIFIEEALSIQRKSRDHAVVKDSFDQIRVDGIVFKAQHPVCKEHQRDGGAGFRIRLIVEQIVINGEGFQHSRRADAARDIHFLCDDIVEERLADIVQESVVWYFFFSFFLFSFFFFFGAAGLFS